MAKKKQSEEEYEDEYEVTKHLSSHAKRSIAAIFLFVVAALFVLGFFHSAGVAGEKMTSLIGKIFGWGKYIAPMVFVFAGAILLRKKVETRFYVTKLIGIFLAFWGILGLFHLLPFDADQFKEMASKGVGGGYLGYILSGPLEKFMGKIAGTIILLALILVGAIIAFNMSFVGLGKNKKSVEQKTGGLFARKKKEDEYEDEDEESEEDEEDEITEEDENISEQDSKDEFDDEFDDGVTNDDEIFEVPPTTVEPSVAATTKDKIEGILNEKDEGERQMTQPMNIDWELPPLKLLKKGGSKAKGGDVKQNALRIQETFRNFGIEMELEDVVTGPTVTQYSFRPQSGVKLTRITALNADLALSLAAHPIRIEAPIPGKSLVGIEVPNKTTATVRMRSLLNTDEFDDKHKKLLLALGEDVNGDYVFEDLATMPHLLVAGTTGAGKSVAVNSIILSLLFKNSPDDLKFILVDPKRV
jgi:S-DNA-T family DNA segregation ATPase FtsK/SpoIIIE